MSINKIKINTPKGVAELTEDFTEIVVPGLDREYTFVHITDLHITTYEETSSPEAIELANARGNFWAIQAGFFAYDEDGKENRIMTDEACELVGDRIRELAPDGVFFTGDTVDYPSGPNFRRAKKYLDSLGCRCFVVPGNHDTAGEGADEDTVNAFNEMMGDSAEYFAESLGALDIVGFADGFVKLNDEQADFLEERIAVGRPMLVLLHAPVFTEAARVHVWPMWGYNWMIGDTGNPEGKQTPANFRFLEQLNTNRDVVRAVIAGHVHKASGDDLSEAKEGEVLQYTSAPAFTGFYRLIKIHG